jgi:hypothetical protein
MKAIYAEAGDTFFTHSNTILGRLIRWGETDPGEPNGTWANHTGVVIQSGWIGEPLTGRALEVLGGSRQAIVIEALWETRRGPLKVNGIDVRVFRPIPRYSPAELGRFTAVAEQYVGAKYGWWKLLVQLGDRTFFRGRKVLTTALFMDKRPICSYLAAKVNAAATSFERNVQRLQVLRYPEPNAFGIPPQAADPDEMLDFCVANPGLWEEIK